MSNLGGFGLFLAIGSLLAVPAALSLGMLSHAGHKMKYYKSLTGVPYRTNSAMWCDWHNAYHLHDKHVKWELHRDSSNNGVLCEGKRLYHLHLDGAPRSFATAKELVDYLDADLQARFAP
jgi:hypothetical protein